MDDTANIVKPRRYFKLALQLLALQLLLAAWGTSIYGQSYARGKLANFGPRPDVFEALNYDKLLCQYQLPYFIAAMGLDFLAIVSISVAVAIGSLRVGGILLVAFCLPTTAYHVLGWCVSSI